MGISHPGDHFIIYAKVKSLFRIPETNMLLYINHGSIKNKLGKGMKGSIEQVDSSLAVMETNILQVSDMSQFLNSLLYLIYSYFKIPNSV